jgi:lipid II:glycine glycyltransferase (peptidoglycan interpeptide bridge formation enzyme)
MDKNKEKYRILCADEPTIPLYSRDWWLDCVCGENNWEALLYYNGEKIEAAWPFFILSKGIISMPEHTQMMGIWFNPELEEKTYSKNLLRKQTICDYFIRHLPSHTYFLQNFHYSFTDWLPFYWKGYRQTTRYNYILPDITPVENLWENLRENIKRNITKAQKKYEIEIKRNVSVELFMTANSNTFERQRMKTYSPEMLKKIIAFSRSRNQGDIWGAFDKQGQLHAAVFIVWQNNCAYYIAAGSHPQLRKSGAHAYVLWEAIREVAEYSSSFDFSGTMLKGVEHFFRGFGAIQMPYYTISKGKFSLRKKLILKIRQYLLKK